MRIPASSSSRPDRLVDQDLGQCHSRRGSRESIFFPAAKPQMHQAFEFWRFILIVRRECKRFTDSKRPCRSIRHLRAVFRCQRILQQCDVRRSDSFRRTMPALYARLSLHRSQPYQAQLGLPCSVRHGLCQVAQPLPLARCRRTEVEHSFWLI